MGIDVSFNQNALICDLAPSACHNLKKINNRFNGLCEIICNYILTRDLMQPNQRALGIKKISLVDLEKAEIVKSHILYLYGIIRIIIAIVLRIYPDNIFSYSLQQKLVIKKNLDKYEINKELLKEGLRKIRNNETLKFLCFSTKRLIINGHSMLIKKYSNNCYSFFDPNSGLTNNLTFETLVDRINEQLRFSCGIGRARAYFTSSTDFLTRLYRA